MLLKTDSCKEILSKLKCLKSANIFHLKKNMLILQGNGIQISMRFGLNETPDLLQITWTFSWQRLKLVRIPNTRRLPTKVGGRCDFQTCVVYLTTKKSWWDVRLPNTRRLPRKLVGGRSIFRQSTKFTTEKHLLLSMTLFLLLKTKCWAAATHTNTSLNEVAFPDKPADFLDKESA